MLIRCSDSCKFQEDGFCGLKNIYSNPITSDLQEIKDTGCIYYQPKNAKKQPPAIKQADQEHQRYF